jgi:hypothetical protein
MVHPTHHHNSNDVTQQQQNKKPLVLDRPNTMTMIINTMHAINRLFMNVEARKQYLLWMQNGIIKEKVLQSSTHYGGTILALNLFHNLYINPLWYRPRPNHYNSLQRRQKKPAVSSQTTINYEAIADDADAATSSAPSSSLSTTTTTKTTGLSHHFNSFDVQHFVSAVGPALENFHNTLGLLRNNMALQQIQQQHQQHQQHQQQQQQQQTVTAGTAITTPSSSAPATTSTATFTPSTAGSATPPDVINELRKSMLVNASFPGKDTSFQDVMPPSSSLSSSSSSSSSSSLSSLTATTTTSTTTSDAAAASAFT